MNLVYLSLGSNEGDRLKHLKIATRSIDKLPVEITKLSSVYETPAMGFEGNAFYNICLELKTLLAPIDLLEAFKKIENFNGRIQRKKDAPYLNRNIDIDILFYNNLIFKNEILTIPHPLLHERIFVLSPLNEITSQFIHPTLKRSVAELLKTNKESHLIKKISDFTY